MKKSLFIIGLALSVAASAQNSRKIQSTGTSLKATGKTAVYPEASKSNAGPVKLKTATRHGNGGNHTSSVTEVTIGASGNCLGPAFGPKTNLWYDQDINTITFAHRSATPTTGLHLFDVSTNAGEIGRAHV